MWRGLLRRAWVWRYWGKKFEAPRSSRTTRARGLPLGEPPIHCGGLWTGAPRPVLRRDLDSWFAPGDPPPSAVWVLSVLNCRSRPLNPHPHTPETPPLPSAPSPLVSAPLSLPRNRLNSTIARVQDNILPQDLFERVVEEVGALSLIGQFAPERLRWYYQRKLNPYT